MREGVKIFLYLLSTVAMVQKLLRLQPLLLQFIDCKLKLVASIFGLVALQGAHHCRRSMSTLHLLVQNALFIFRRSVDWKADIY